MVLHSCQDSNLLAHSAQHGVVYPAVTHYPGLANELHDHLQIFRVAKSSPSYFLNETYSKHLNSIIWHKEIKVPYLMSITASYCLPDKTKGSFTHSVEWFVVFFKLPVTGSRVLQVHSRAQRSSLTALTNLFILEIKENQLNYNAG